MAQIRIMNLAGVERLVEEGKPFRLEPGEVVVGSVGHQDNLNLLNKIVQESGYGLGDLTEALAKPIAMMMGLQNCTSCNIRKVLMNLIGKLGIKKTYELIRRSFTEPANIIAAEIKKALEN